MVGADVADLQEVVPKQHVASPVSASNMVVERGVRLKGAPVVLRGRLACASLTVGGAGASISPVPRALREAPCTAKHMVGGNDAYFPDATKVRKGALPSAKGMVGGSVAYLMVEGYARKVFMVALISVLLMAGERGVQSQDVLKALEGKQIVVSNTEVGSDANLRTAIRVLKEAQTFARHMAAERGATGARESARSLLGGRVGYVQHIVVWFLDEIRAEVE